MENLDNLDKICTKVVDAVSKVLDEHLEEQKCFHEVRIFYGYFEFANLWCKRLENSKKIQIPAMGKLSLDSKGIQINCFGKDKNVMAEKALKLNPAQESGETKMSNDHNDPGAIDLTKIDAFRINDKMEDILNEKSKVKERRSGFGRSYKSAPTELSRINDCIELREYSTDKDHTDNTDIDLMKNQSIGKEMC